MSKSIFFLLVVLISTTYIYAQEIIPFPESNSSKHIKNTEKVLKPKEPKIKTHREVAVEFSNTDKTLDIIDTIYMVQDLANFSTNFGFLGQDYLVQWFQAPADLDLKEVGFCFYSAYLPVTDLEMKVIACTLPIDSLQI